MTILRGKLGNFREKLGKCKLEGGGGENKKSIWLKQQVMMS